MDLSRDGTHGLKGRGTFAPLAFEREVNSTDAVRYAASTLMPSGVRFSCGPISATEPPSEFVEEELLLIRSMPSRKNEFRAGRRHAREVLSQLGVPPCAIGRGPLGLPLWPTGSTGSIAHTSDLCIALACKVDLTRTLGADLEYADCLQPNELPLVISPQDSVDPADADVCFSAKESVYKAYFNLSRVMLDFWDVRLTVRCANGEFVAEIHSSKPPIMRTRTLVGRFARAGGYVLTVAIPSPSASLLYKK